ncbi:MAG: leucine-rich repeat protein [Kiritimatiellae bacterium]|nr:leucine-rich repeat protein [Kiritimatiellia bacterium]
MTRIGRAWWLPALFLLAAAAPVKAGGFICTTNSDNTITIADYDGPGGAVVIPSAIGGKTVTTIGEHAFQDCTSLTSVTIPNGVIRIEGGGLDGGAFSSCSNLISVTLPGSVTSIGDYAFYSCASLSGITLPNSVTRIENYAFYACSSLTSVALPNSVTSVGDHAFYACTSLTSVVIGNGVTNIGDRAFCGCNGLAGVTLPNSVTRVGDFAFSPCMGLPIFPFTNASSLASVMIGNSVATIGDCAFYSCANLANVTLPDSVTRIGNYAFYACSSLAGVTIPGSVTSIGDYAFFLCASLSAITVAAQNAVYSSLEGVLFNKSRTTLIQCPGGKTGSYTIPVSVTTIGDCAFYACTGLTGVYFQGNAPSLLNADVFNGADNATVYYLSGTTGWEPTFCGRPTALWTTPLSVPAGVSASDGTYADKIHITWSAVPGTASYDVWRNAADASGSAMRLASSLVDTSYDDTSAVAGKIYYYWVIAVNAAGASTFSSSDAGQRSPPVAVSAPPSGVRASDGTYAGKVRVTWNVASDAASYEVWRHTGNSSGAASKISSPDLTETSFDDTSAAAGITYYYWLKAVNAVGVSAFSSPDSGYVADNRPPTGSADLALSDLIFLPNRLKRGDHPGIFSVVLINYGPGSLALPNTRIVVDVYLSPDTTLGNDNDLWIGDYQSGMNLSAGHRATISVSGMNRDRLTIPSTAAGRYYVFARVRHAVPSTLADPNVANNSVMCANTITISSSGMVHHSINDYDGDGKTDLVVYRDGYWSIFSMTGGVILDNAGVWGGPGWIPVPGNYDGDGKSDLAVYRDGYWSIYSMAGHVLLDNAGVWGGPDWIPVPGDYDGDGKTDLAVYRDGYWSIYLMASGVLLDNAGVWGGPDWIPVPGDYDGDGKTDLAVYRDGYWSIYLMASGVLLDNAGVWGGPDWIPVPGDYDGDGKTDLAVYRDGYWSIYLMAGGVLLDNAGILGGPDSIPVPGDYDGDGKSDLAVYHDGYWTICLIAGSVITGGWGGSDWIPVHY